MGKFENNLWNFAFSTLLITLIPILCSAETFTFENVITPEHLDNGFRGQTLSEGPYRLQVHEGFLISDEVNAEAWARTTANDSHSFHPTKGAVGVPLEDVSLVAQRLSIFRSDAAAFVLCSANIAKRKNGANYRPLRVYADQDGSGLMFINDEPSQLVLTVTGNSYEHKTFHFPGSVDQFKRFEFVVGLDQLSQGLLHFDDIQVANSIQNCE